MKKTGIFVVLIILISVNLSFAGILPYYSFQFSEGAYLPSKGNWGMSTMLTNDIGIISKFSDVQALMGLYELRYTGPGLKRNEGETFDQRTMSHVFLIQDSWKLSNMIMLKIKFNQGIDYLRTGANEIWGTGLYDMTRSGGGVDCVINNWGLKINVGLALNSLQFPNYTDLMDEYKAGSEETSAGKQNNIMTQINAGVQFDKNTVSFNYITQDYDKQYIVDTTLTYSKTEKQKETTTALSFGRKEEVVKGKIKVAPLLTLKFKDSNQSFLNFKTETLGPGLISQTTIYMPNYYDYNKFTLAIPATFQLTKTKSITVSPEFEWTNYAVREPRDVNNNVLKGEKQSNQLTILYFGYNFTPDDVTNVNIFYIQQSQISNMKYENYYPYNYSSQYFGVKYSYTF